MFVGHGTAIGSDGWLMPGVTVLAECTLGDRVNEMITFRSATQMYETNYAGSATSDVLTWLGDNYRVYVVKNYSEQGYYLAIAARKSGE